MAPTRKAKPEGRRSSERQQLARAIEQSKKDAAPQGITKRKRFRRPKQRKSCHLLNLPGELRNEIYTHVLVQRPNSIDLRIKGPGEPALLRVCRAIRAEARSIYYAENDFRLTITDFDGAAYAPFARQYVSYEPAPPKVPNVSFLLHGEPNWENLVRWVKSTHNSYCAMRPDMDDPICNNDYVVGAAFKLSDALPAWAGEGMLEKVLEALLHGLKGTCSRWAHESGH